MDVRSSSLDESKMSRGNETSLLGHAQKPENPLLTIVRNMPLNWRGFNKEQREFVDDCITTRVRI